MCRLLLVAFGLFRHLFQLAFPPVISPFLPRSNGHVNGSSRFRSWRHLVGNTPGAWRLGQFGRETATPPCHPEGANGQPLTRLRCASEAIRAGNGKSALSSRAQRSGVEGSQELATTPDVLGSSRDPSTPLRCARDDRSSADMTVLSPCAGLPDAPPPRSWRRQPPAPSFVDSSEVGVARRPEARGRSDSLRPPVRLTETHLRTLYEEGAP